MIKYMLLALIIFATSCGQTRNVVKQNVADFRACVSAMGVTEDLEWTKNHYIKALLNYLSTFQQSWNISEDEIPAARVPMSDFLLNATAAAAVSDTNRASDTKTISSDFTNTLLMGGTILSAIMLALKGIKLAGAGSIVGSIAGWVDILFLGGRPDKAAVGDNVIASLEGYKAANKDWRADPVFKHLSGSMSKKDKALIKDKTV